MDIARIESLNFDEKSHTYVDQLDGIVLTPVSKILSKYKTDFDELTMSKFVAKQRKITQAEVLKEWKDKRVRSLEYGTHLHWVFENCINNVEIDLQFAYNRMCNIRGESGNVTTDVFLGAITNLKRDLIDYRQVLTEFRIYDPTSGVAGTMDLCLIRNNNVVDIYDFKTNIENGITFDSIKRSNGLFVKDYGRRMKGIFSHLEDCNYNHYALQLSMYALMMELKFGVNIGKLVIKFLDSNLQWTNYPVPYMRYDAFNILDDHKNNLTDNQADRIIIENNSKISY
jgi:hypothetical protein